MRRRKNEAKHIIIKKKRNVRTSLSSHALSVPQSTFPYKVSTNPTSLPSSLNVTFCFFDTPSLITNGPTSSNFGASNPLTNSDGFVRFQKYTSALK